MKPFSHSDIHLTYCSNIHPGESWQDLFSQLKKYLPDLRRRLSPNRPFGVGLRLSALAATELNSRRRLNEFSNWMQEESLYLFTMNGFPYGNFHGSEVKDRVYWPDWRSEERVDYTANLTSILAHLLPESVDGGISTSPLSYKYWPNGPDSKDELLKTCSVNLARIAWQMAEIERETGKELHLDIEPEPDCTLENSREVIDYFTGWLFIYGRDYLCRQHEISLSRSTEILRNHIRICYDTCHFAVEYEEPASAIRAITDAGIRIGKTQISAALRLSLDSDPESRERAAKRLLPFDESTYLHQVVQRSTDGTLKQFRDLGSALPHIGDPEAEEWRIHFHVPVFLDRFDEEKSSFRSTQNDITASLKELLKRTDCRHFEIETYTWDVLPEALKVDITDSIEREYKWVSGIFETLDSKGTISQ